MPSSPIPEPAAYTEYTDQMGRRVRIPHRPRRIVSLVPSQTELLFDLGLGEAVVGLTKFCVHPAGKKQEKTVVGGTKKFDFATIARLQPDLIIGNKEENYREGVEQLAEAYPVWMSDISNLAEALHMIRQVGQITDKGPEAGRLAEEIQQKFDALKPMPSTSVAYLIWRDPYMTIGTDTFIQEMLERCGLHNVFGHQRRYPVLSPAELAQANPRIILLSSEPFPFREKHREEFQALCPAAEVRVVDGEMFSWYGSRLRHAPAYLLNLLTEIANDLKS